MNSLNSLKFADVTTVIGPDQRQREDFLQEGGLQPENNLSLNVEQGTDCGLQEERTVVLSSCIAIAGTAVERVSIHLTEAYLGRRHQLCGKKKKHINASSTSGG